MKKAILILQIILIVITCIIPELTLFIIPGKTYASTTFTANLTGPGTDLPGGYGIYYGGAANYTNLQTDDGDTTRLYLTYGSGYHDCSYTITTFSAAYWSIDSVTIYYKARADYYGYGYNERPYVLIGGSRYYGSTASPYPMTYTYTLYSHTWNTNPATGSAWDAAAINSAEYGLSTYNTDSTYMYVVISYTVQSVPTLTTNATSNIIYNVNHYALLNGTVLSWSGNNTDIYKGFVYGTGSIAANPGNVGPYASGYTTVSANVTGTGTGDYSSNITGMAAGLTYYYRAYAHNGIGYAYGNELSFTTLTNPTISLLAATLVSSSTARVNSQVTFDGNWSTCNITFGYALASHAANFAAYTSFANVAGTYATGQFPYYDLSSLNASATYYFNVRIQNPYGTAYGTETTFTTPSNIIEPYNVKAIPSSNTISVSWIKSTALYSMVRYSTGTYPAGTAIGTLAYLGTGSSCLITGLLEGVTYYISVWGMTGGIYSSNYTYTLATTTAYTTTTTTTISRPADPPGWNQGSSSSGFQLPIISQIIKLNSDSYGMPVNTFWYIGWFLGSVILGLVVYNKGGNNLTQAMIGSLGELFIGVIGGLLGFEVVAIVAGIGLGLVVLIGRY